MVNNIHAEQLLSFAAQTPEAESPSWLKSSPEADEWVIVDESAHPDGTVTRTETRIDFRQPLPGGSVLTDPQYSRTLRTIRLFLLLTRRGAHKSDARRLMTCVSGTRQAILAGMLFNLFRYCVLHEFSSFAELTQGRLDDVLDKLIWGTDRLLDVDQRVDDYIERTRTLPSRARNAVRQAPDMAVIATALGITVTTLTTNQRVQLKLQRAAKSQGLYINPSYDATEREEKMQPRVTGSIYTYVSIIRGLYGLRAFGLESFVNDLDLMPFSPWPGVGPKRLARTRVDAVVAQLSDEEKRIRQQQERTRSITAESGLQLVNAAIHFIATYANELLLVRDQHWPEAVNLELERRTGPQKIREARARAIYSLNRKLQSQISEDPLCPWPFRGIAMNLRSEVHQKTKYFFEKSEIEPLVAQIQMGELTWTAAAKKLGLKSRESLKRIWNRVGNPLSPARLTGRPSLHQVINGYLPAACYIILAAFSARRESELLDLRANCILDPVEARHIEIYSAKYLRAWEIFPCVPIMKYIVDILLQWSKPAREKSGDNRIFQVHHVFSWEPYTRLFNTRDSLEEFTKFAGIKLQDVYGETIKLSDHQFRRLFANLFLHRFTPNVAGKLEALSHQLRHFDPAVTEHYVREVISGQAYDETLFEMSASALTKVMTGQIGASGGLVEHLGKSAKRLQSRFRADVEVVSENRAQRDYGAWLVEKTVNRVIKMQMAVTPLPWGYCYGRGLPLRRFCRCNNETQRQQLVEPNLPNANIETCRQCPNLMRLDDHLPCIQSYGEQMLAAARDEQNPPMLRSACGLYASGAQQVVKFHISYPTIENV